MRCGLYQFYGVHNNLRVEALKDCWVMYHVCVHTFMYILKNLPLQKIVQVPLFFIVQIRFVEKSIRIFTVDQNLLFKLWDIDTITSWYFIEYTYILSCSQYGSFIYIYIYIYKLNACIPNKLASIKESEQAIHAYHISLSHAQ